MINLAASTTPVARSHPLFNARTVKIIACNGKSATSDSVFEMKRQLLETQVIELQCVTNNLLALLGLGWAWNVQVQHNRLLQT